MPFITVKIAQTLDGRIATSTGQSQWISGSESLKYAHELRRDHDAILVGIGTVLADDPQLNVRLVEGKDPVRIIVDGRLRIPLTARVLSDKGARGVIIATSDKAESSKIDQLESRGAGVLIIPSESSSVESALSGRIDLIALMDELSRREIESVLVEGGASLITSLLRARLVDRLIAVIAPKILGAGVEWAEDLGITELRDAVTFTSFETSRLGDDIVFNGMIRK